MTLRCTSRYASIGAPCQDRQHPDGLHHGHTDSQCLQWADGGVHFSKPIGDCPWPPAHEVAQRAEELGAMIKARRERLTVVAVEHPDDELLRAEINRLRYEEASATGGLGLYPPHEQRLADDYTPDWRTIELAEQHLGFIDPDLTVAVQDLWAQNTARGVEIERLRAELAKSRRDALFSASEIAGSVQAETSADKALCATIVAKLRVAAMADDECAKCGHRRGDHQHHGGICKVRRSATTHCACRQYVFAAVTTTPKEG